MKNSLRVVGDAPSLNIRLDVSNCATDIMSPEETPEALYQWDTPVRCCGVICIRTQLIPSHDLEPTKKLTENTLSNNSQQKDGKFY